MRESISRFLLRYIFVFEPLASPAISFYLNRRLGELKNRGRISDYKTHTKRLGKFHYRIDMDLDLTGKQAYDFLNDMLPNQLNFVRRWFNV